jgi:His/Glu/Gln/Arg/opine family amino acid ABC transporter permease subunit
MSTELFAAARLDFSIVGESLPDLARGALWTFEITATGIVGMLLVGIVGAGMRTSVSSIARKLATAFAEFFRNTPPLVHIFFAYFALPIIGIKLPAFVAGTLALMFYQGAIAIEILRAGIEAVPKGQYEAASALGLSGFEQFRSIVMPQAFRISLPALGNNLISLLKNTSLVSAIGTIEITGVANDIIAIRLTSAELYLTLGAFYLVCVFVLSTILRISERNLARYGT